MRKLFLFFLLTGCGYQVTTSEHEAVTGLHARVTLLEAHAASISSDQRIIALISEAATLGASSERFNEAIRNRTGFVAPVISGSQWVESR